MQVIIFVTCILINLYLKSLALHKLIFSVYQDLKHRNMLKIKEKTPYNRDR